MAKAKQRKSNTKVRSPDVGAKLAVPQDTAVSALPPATEPDDDDEDFDVFVEAFLECAIWADLPEDVEEEEIHPACFKKINLDCRQFLRENKKLLNEAYEMDSHYGPYNAGRDFWLSRNGHGVGFWDRGLGKIGDHLHEAAYKYGAMNVLPGKIKRKNWIFVE